MKYVAMLHHRVIAAQTSQEEGATAVEYGIMVAAIAAVIVATVYSIGGKIGLAFNTVDGAM